MNRLTAKSLIFLALLLLVALPAGAQDRLKFSIADFSADPFDLSAKNAAYEKYDGNGDRYAIIKVTSNNPDENLSEYNFNFGNMKHIVEDHDGVLWIYVQRNAKLVTVTRNGYVPINRYDLHTTIESGRNYVMSLTSEARRVLTQMVQFNIEPASARAVVMVKSSREGAPEEIFGYADASGAVAKSLEYGTYTYKVLADNYHMSEGRFTLDDKNRTFVETVKLRSNFSDITFTVDADADIYINGEKKGTRQWSGQLKAGNYQVECRQADHNPTTEYVKVTENDRRTITLKAPEAITGTVAVTSSPLGADIEIDGRNYGVTPRNIDIIIGKHEITLSKKDYRPHKETFEVREDRNTEVSATLGHTAQATIASTPDGASVYVDDAYQGETPFDYVGEAGDHKLKLFLTGYKPMERTVNFGAREAQTLKFTLQRQLVKKSDFYVQAGIGLGSTMSAGVDLGAHLAGVNVELGYDYSLNKAQTIYWNYIGDSPDGTTLEANYKPHAIIKAKVGYGINAGTRFKITPQVGYRYTWVAEDGASMINGANCSAVSVGVRAYCAIMPHLGVSLTPEYAIAVSKSEGFGILSDVSSRIAGFGSGFNVKVSLVATF